MNTSNEKKLLQVAHQSGVLRARDLSGLGIPRRLLTELVVSGKLIRIGRGLYRVAGGELSANHSLAEVAKRVPRGVICLISALRFHELTTELPSEVWVAVGPKAWKPQFERPKIRVMRFSGVALTAGVETFEIEGINVRVYGIAKTIADCFKFRNKIGTNIAVEAMRNAWRSRRVTADELVKFAKYCRVDRVMRPYQEGLE